jgi:DNA adenine methylase
MDSVLNWVGGKSLSAEKIVKLMPDHDCYVEVFGGALWIYFRKSPSKVEVVNDINGELINFYRCVQRKHKEFLERTHYEMYSRELYYEYLNDFYSGKHKELDDVERAFRFYCLIKEAFGAKFGGGWGYSSARNMATAFFNEFLGFDAINERLKNTQIDNRDFEEIINGYDGERTLFYVDPPYCGSANDLYYFKCVDTSFSMWDHQRLYMALKNIKGKFILTVDDCEWVRERYCVPDSGFTVIENEVFYSSADKDNRRHVIELIITNFNPNGKKHVDARQGQLNF